MLGWGVKEKIGGRVISPFPSLPVGCRDLSGNMMRGNDVYQLTPHFSTRREISLSILEGDGQHIHLIRDKSALKGTFS